MLLALVFLAFHLSGKALGSTDRLYHVPKVPFIGLAKQDPFVEVGVLNYGITASFFF